MSDSSTIRQEIVALADSEVALQAVHGIPLSQLTLFPATKAQIYESRKRTFTMWGRGVTFEEYMKRDARSIDHEVSRNGSLITWILTRRDDPRGLDFLCSCETYKREGFVVDANATTGRSVICYGVASLFTDPRQRKKGYATHLMRMLHWVLAPLDVLPPFPKAVWGEQPNRDVWVDAEQVIDGHGGNAVFSALYSDVGPEIYRACGILPGSEGWVVTEPFSSGWDVESLDISEGQLDEDRGWEWLDLEAMYEHWKVDVQLMKREMEDSKQTTAISTFLPHNGLAEFQILRLTCFWNKLGIRYWGVCKGNAFASWTVDIKQDSSYVMLITRLRVANDEFEELVRVLVGFGKRHGIKYFEVWGLRKDLREKFDFVKTWNRVINLPSIRSYESKDFKWVFNERFCYC